MAYGLYPLILVKTQKLLGMSTRQAGPIFLLVLSIAAFAVMAGSFIALPGLQYDEVLFVNAALGGIDDNFIYKRILGMPVMLMPYIGALKAYVYFPIFQLFDVSPATIRLPVILVSCFTLWVAFRMGSFLMNPWYAALLVVVMGTDPAFIFPTKLDWGPIALMMFLKMLSLYLFFRLVAARSASYLWILFAVLLLGVFDKLNFLWFVLALGLTAMMFYRMELLQAVRQARPRWLVVLLFPGVLLLVLIYAISTGLKMSDAGGAFAERLFQIAGLYKGTMNGRLVYELVTGSPFGSPTYANYYLLPALAILAAGWLVGGRATSILKPFSFLGLVAGLIFLQLLFTPQVGGPHHALMLYPFHHLATILAAFIVVSGFIPERLRRIRGLVLIVIFMPLVSSQLRAATEYLDSFRNGSQFSNTWSPEIYDLARYLQQNHQKFDFIVSADWGVHNQLFALAEPRARRKYVDLWPSFNELHNHRPEQRQWLFQTFFQDRKILVLLHSEEASMMENVHGNFLSFSSEFLKNAKLVREFRLYGVYLTSN